MPTASSREWDSESYHRIAEPQYEWGKKVVARLTLRGDETVLDAGCGTGRLTAEVLRKLPRGRVIALDLSQNMLGTACRELEARFGHQVRFICANLLAIPLCQAVDGIFSTAVLHWVPDHPKLFAELHSALRPGGWLEAQCGGGPNLRRLRTRAAELMAREPFNRYMKDFQDRREYADEVATRERLRNAGFEEVRVWTEAAPATFPTPERFKEFIGAVNMHKYVGHIQDPAIVKHFLDELTTAAAGDDPPYTLDYWRMNISARKPQ